MEKFFKKSVITDGVVESISGTERTLHNIYYRTLIFRPFGNSLLIFNI
jgi:hypothetical protein